MDNQPVNNEIEKFIQLSRSEKTLNVTVQTPL